MDLTYTHLVQYRGEHGLERAYDILVKEDLVGVQPNASLVAWKIAGVPEDTAAESVPADANVALKLSIEEDKVQICKHLDDEIGCPSALCGKLDASCEAPHGVPFSSTEVLTPAYF